MASRLDAVEATVEATVETIKDSMDMYKPFTRVEDIWAELDHLSDELGGVMNSVGFLLMEDEQSWWVDD